MPETAERESFESEKGVFMPQSPLRLVMGLAVASLVTHFVDAETPRQPLTLELIFSPDTDVRIEFSGSPLAAVEWLDNGTHFLQSSRDSDAFLPPLKTDAATGESIAFFAHDSMIAALSSADDCSAQAARDLPADAVHFSPDHSALVVHCHEDLYYYRLGAAAAVRLTQHPAEEQVDDFSPDGEWLAFVREHDLHVVRIDSQTETRLTRRGSRDLLLGKLDWVYQEEIYGRGNFQGYWWSPDSSRIAFLELDESEVPEIPLVDHLPRRVDLEVIHYPKAGDPNPRARLGVVRPTDREIVWIDTSSYQQTDHLIVRVGWTPDSRRVVFLVQDREQTWLDINLADPASGSVTTLVHETSPAFVDVDLTGAPHWLEDGSFLWLSGRTGYHHLYRFAAGGESHRQLTHGGWEIRELYGVDEERGYVYFSASKDSPIEDHVYRARLDGSQIQRLSQRAGNHSAKFNSDFSAYLDTWSDIHTPPKVFLHRADGAELAVVDANDVGALARYSLAQVEFLQVPTPDGFVMEAALIKPPDFDPDRLYPVLQYNYGGPHAPVVRNAWGGPRHMWFRYLAQEGYIVWMCDNRSASAKGVAPTWQAYERLGEIELRDIEAGLAWLEQQPWVDASRIAIYGGSYGGFLAAFALTHSDSFRLGIAWAPVTDWHLYDSIYTERFMRTPQENPEGYRATSVLEAAADLDGAFLLIHGTIDDNVHLQNSLKLAHALQMAGKDFQLMLYPTSRHGLRQPDQRYHLYRLMTRFLRENL